MYNNNGNNRRPQGRTGGYNNNNGGEQRQKLEYVFTKSTFREQVPERDGGISDRLILYFDRDQAYQLIDLIERTLGPDGIRFTAYTGDKLNQKTNEIFDSTAISVQPFQKKDNDNGEGTDRGNRQPSGRLSHNQQGRTGYSNQQQQTRTGRATSLAPDTSNIKDRGQQAVTDTSNTNTNQKPSANKAEDIPF